LTQQQQQQEGVGARCSCYNLQHMQLQQIPRLLLVKQKRLPTAVVVVVVV
jgi:hypothetical protein